VVPPITIVIAGGTLSGWNGLARCFSRQAGFVLVRCLGPAEETLSCCRRLSPCALIVEESFLDEVDPVQFPSLAGYGQFIQTLVILSSEDPGTIKNLLRAGFAGYLCGQPPATTLRRAVQAVASGELWAGRRFVSSVFRCLLSNEHAPGELSRREKEVLTLLASGLRDRAIAGRLLIRPQAVRWHIQSLFAKIGVQDRLGAAFYVWESTDQPSLRLPAKKTPSKVSRQLLSSAG